MSIYTSTQIILAVMVATYIVAKVLKVSTEISMFAAALTGGLAGGVGIPARHIVEGAFTYLDIILIFITATIFMNILKESGGVVFVVRGILRKFFRRKSILFVLLTFLLLLPGALTGAGSVTVLITGGMVAIVLGYMGISKPKTAAIIFILAGLSAAAPPVSLWAMLTAAGVNMPYVGFFLPLLIPCLLLSLITIFILGWRGKTCESGKSTKRASRSTSKDELDSNLAPLSCFSLLGACGKNLASFASCSGVADDVYGSRFYQPVAFSRENKFSHDFKKHCPPAPAFNRDFNLCRNPGPDYDAHRSPGTHSHYYSYPSTDCSFYHSLPCSSCFRGCANVGSCPGSGRSSGLTF